MLAVLAIGCDASAGSKTSALTVKNTCVATDDMLTMHALFDVNYTKATDGPYRSLRAVGDGLEDGSRQVFSLACQKDDCAGVWLRLGNVDKGRPLEALDVVVVDGASVASRTGDVVTIKWGPLRLFTIDFARGVVSYVESGDGLYLA